MLSSFFVILPFALSAYCRPLGSRDSSVPVNPLFSLERRQAQNTTAKNVAGGNSNANNNTGNGDPQKSLTLDPSVIAKGFLTNGLNLPGADDQTAPSLTSSNNFINFCVGKTLTDGKQIQAGSCNNAPIGDIPSIDKIPSSKFKNPKNGDTLAVNQKFTIEMNIRNLVTGDFVNANTNYYAAPQQLVQGGTITGHTHFVIEPLAAKDATDPLDVLRFAFFKGINTPAQNGVLSQDVSDGLPAGEYRLCSINSSSNHQPVIVAVAQHGFLDDCVYFTVGDEGNKGGNAAANNNGTSVGAKGNNGNKGNQINNNGSGGK